MPRALCSNIAGWFVAASWISAACGDLPVDSKAGAPSGSGGGGGGSLSCAGHGRWSPMSNTGMPEGRWRFVAAWTGTEMLIWGGEKSVALDIAGAVPNGWRYHLGTDAWSAVPAEGGPGFLYPLTGVWTGKEMILWGNTWYPEPTGRGALYDPKSGKWADLSSCDAPPWGLCPAIWTGTQMILWGGDGAHVWGGIFTP